ncbi:hypothetical protein [Litorivivens sp.]
MAFNIDPDVWPNPDARRVRLYYALDVNRFRGTEQLQLMVQSLEVMD